MVLYGPFSPTGLGKIFLRVLFILVVVLAHNALVSAGTVNTIWPASAVPGTVDAGPDAAVELGVKFRSDVNGTVTGIRFYKASTNTGTHVGNLWSSSGTLLATATFTNETASGWQQVNFATPVAITASTMYVASYHCDYGHYADSQNYFATAGYNNPPLHVLQDGVSGYDGVYAYGTVSLFPTQGWYASNYWVDVVFTPVVSLTSIAVTPVNPTVTASGTQQFAATGTYSDGTTKSITTQVTWSSSNPAVATVNSSGLVTAIAGGGATIRAVQGSVSGSTTLTVQATALSIGTSSFPSGVVGQPYSTALAGSGGIAPYTWSLISGTLPAGLTLSSAGQISGTPSAAATSALTVQVQDSGSPPQTATKQLSIVIAASTSYSIWSPAALPTHADDGADSPVELGVKFKSDVSGVIAGVRFYKAGANTGVHVGNLWSSTGTLLATATFTSETASGWQQVNFPSPVAITANTVYVASYHTTIGHYPDDQNYFATSGVDNSPLHALAAGVSGYNGVFAYGTNSLFPNQNWYSSNYWVDVVFMNTAATSPSSFAVSVNPTTASVAPNGNVQFAATVSGTSNTAVTWSVASGGGTVSASGLYTAPSAAGTATVMATSVANPQASALANVTINAPTTMLLSALPSAVTFNSTVVGASTSNFVTLSNTGNSAVTISSASVTGSGFSVSGLTLPFTLAAGATSSATVTFAPLVTGPATGTASFVSNATNSPATVTLGGSATAPLQHSVSLTWQASTSVVVGYNVYRTTISGGPYTALNTALDTNTTYVDSSVQSGQTYYYVVTAVDSSGIESAYSNQVIATVPTP